MERGCFIWLNEAGCLGLRPTVALPLVITGLGVSGTGGGGRLLRVAVLKGG